MNRMVSAPVTLIVCVYAGGSNTPLPASLSILPAMPALLSFHDHACSLFDHSEGPRRGENTARPDFRSAFANVAVHISRRALRPRTRRRHGLVSRCHPAI